MTKLLEKALEAVRRLPPDSQDEIALAMRARRGRRCALARHLWRASLKPSVASSPLMPRSKRRSAASSDETSLHSPSDTRSQQHCRLRPRAKSESRSDGNAATFLISHKP